MGKKRFLIIDGNALIHRAFHALPPLKTKKGVLVNAVYGFLLVFFKALRELKPEFVAATFDLPAPTFRHEKFKEYKARRPRAPEELYQQIPILKKILKVFNIAIFEKEGFEADDIIGTITNLVEKKQIFPKIENIILSGDLDTLQLIDSETKVYTLKKGVKDTVLYDEKAVQERYGLLPKQMADFKALSGDPSDNIPGIPGIGEKTASLILKEFGTIEELYRELEKRAEKTKILKPKLKEILLKSKDQVFFNKMLVSIRRDAPLEFNLGKCRWEDYNQKEAIKILKELEFQSLIPRLPLSKKEMLSELKKRENGDKIKKTRSSGNLNLGIKVENQKRLF